MYAYLHDPKTGGLLLQASPSSFSKEPRPVYAKELDLLGFDQFWHYDKQEQVPYLWAESNIYWYRGQKVARISQGSLFERPTITLEKDENQEPILGQGFQLQAIDMDAMLAKNQAILAALERGTLQRIYAVYEEYKRKYDCFRVAFSGGKDSIVLLDLVKHAVPAKDLIVLFGDTGMEFPDTYALVEQIEAQCREENIAFYRAVSDFEAKDSWQIFGPPSRIVRWCCSVHKSVPQALKMRSVLGSCAFKEFVFVGVRASESEARSKYDYVTKSHKIKGQATCNAILDWSSAEIWLYVFAKNLLINEAYKIGNQRVGCLYCPMSLKTDYIKNAAYTQQMKPFVDIALANYEPADLVSGYWCARTNGTQLKENKQKVFETYDRDGYTVEVIEPTTDIRQWLKTLGTIDFPYTLSFTPTGFTVHIPPVHQQSLKNQISKFKCLVYKAAYCVACGLCEANCQNGCLSFKDGLHIDGCKHCQACNSVENGCLLFTSRRFPSLRGEMNMTVVDCFATHAPKTAWLTDFFAKEDAFLKENTLGPEQVTRFRKFLRSADLLSEAGFTPFARCLKALQWDSETALGLMLTNLASNPQIRWYIKNLPINMTYTRQEAAEILKSQGYKEIATKNVVAATKRFAELPLGTRLHFCKVTKKGNVLETLTRTKVVPLDARVILYALYKFAEACGGYYEFTLARLMDFSVTSDGISPAELFGLSRDEMEQYLNELAYNQTDFLSYTATHGLNLVRLEESKKSNDVLALFS